MPRLRKGTGASEPDPGLGAPAGVGEDWEWSQIIDIRKAEGKRYVGWLRFPKEDPVAIPPTYVLHLGLNRKACRVRRTGGVVHGIQIDDRPLQRWWPTASPSDTARRIDTSGLRAEEQALIRLGHADGLAYLRLRESVIADPESVAVQQRLLVAGRLPGDYDLRGERQLLDHLVRVAGRSPLRGLSRGELVASLLAEVETPLRIRQGTRRTCGAAVVQMLLARNSPPEYVRIVSELAMPRGLARLVGGETLQRDPGSEQGDESGRSLSSRLIQAAFMEFANLGDDYDPAADENIRPDGSRYAGLFFDQIHRLLEAVTGIGFEKRDVNGTSTWSMLTGAAGVLRRGNLVPVLMDRKKAGHYVLLEALEPQRVRLIDPWGRETGMARRDFEQRLLAVAFPKLPNPLLAFLRRMGT
ncbi:MAG: hypothetical protein HYY93_01460 [Planctomycetes bacterium]|nr:hypothetical protein [Planctomycetota bacterium]